MNFWMMRALARDHYYAEKEGVYANSGCGEFLLKVLIILVILVLLRHCGVITDE